MRGKKLTAALVAIFMLVGVRWAFAIGAHDMNCLECHNIHYAKGDYIIGPQPKTDIQNPATTRLSVNVQGIDALCLGCHNEDEGIMPINLHTTHPTGVAPTYVSRS